MFDESFSGARDLYGITVPQMEAMHGAMKKAPGVVAARQAGGGFGGCMIALVEKGRVEEFIGSVEHIYKETTGIQPVCYSVSPGPGVSLLEC